MIFLTADFYRYSANFVLDFHSCSVFFTWNA